MKKVLLACIVSIGAFSIEVLSDEQPESTVVIQPKIAVYNYSAMPKDPLASMFFSATIPGTGQIYNKEYLHGILTGIGFWGGLFTSELLLEKWIRINTDTVYFEEFDRDGSPTGLNRAVYIMRDPDKQVGLPTAEKIALGSAVLIGAASYIYGLLDSYRGAKRFNRKLVASAPVTPSLYYSLGTSKSEAGIRLNF
jgi:TM2 domain-containing membrane protein YozV